MKELCKKIWIFSMSLILAFSLVMSFQIPVMASDGSDGSENFVTVSPNGDFDKDGKYHVRFKLSNITDKSVDPHYNRQISQDIYFSAKVVSYGCDYDRETIFTWKEYTYKPGESKNLDFAADYRTLPSKRYRFTLTARTFLPYSLPDGTCNSLEWNWNYTIHLDHDSSISFKSLENIVNSKGVKQQKFSFQYTNLKGRELTYKIYNSNGKPVYLGKKLKLSHDNGIVSFYWSGRANVGSKKKCESGQYTIYVFYGRHCSPIKKTFKFQGTPSITFQSLENIANSEGVRQQKFNFQCTNMKGRRLTYKIYNSNGELVVSHKGSKISSDNTIAWVAWDGWANVGSKKKCEPGKYTIQIYDDAGKQMIKKSFDMKDLTPSISFKSFEKIISLKYGELQRFNIQCKNIKGEKLVLRIYDSDGKLVYSDIGPARKTNNEVGWFYWNGWTDVDGSRQKCKSGQYTVEVYYTGGRKIIQKTYNLII
jgi:flagellar hook assembly protein FlgD